MEPQFRPFRFPLSLWVVLILAALETGRLHVQAYPTGAGKEACASQSPQVCHKGSPQTTTSPYTLVVTDTTYSPGVTIKVTIDGGNTPFEGFLLGAHRVEGNTTEYLGSFGTTKDSHPQCGAGGNTGVTHSSSSNKTSITVVWTPPSTSQGNIVFTTAVLKDFKTYWVNISSGTLKPKGFHPSNHTVTTPPPPPIPKFPKTSGCGKTMSCYGDCEDDLCTFLAMWYKDDQSLVITIKSVESSGDNFWTSLGFGTSASMNPASVTACVANKGQVQAFTAYNDGYDCKKVTPDPKVALSNVSGSVMDGVFTCTAYRQITVSGAGPEVFNLTKPFHILMARAAASGWELQPHDAQNAFVTDDSYNVTANVDIGAHGESTWMVKLHGSLMTVAWILSASIGILVARYCKPVWGQQTLCGVKVWFAIHRLVMVIAFLFTIAAFVIIFVHVGGYRQINGPDYQKAHPVLGIIVLSLTVINPIMSLFRCDPSHDLRPVFNWAHFLVGISAYILGVVTVGIGLHMPMEDIPQYVTYCVIGFGAWQLMAYIMLEMTKCCEMNDANIGLYKDLQSFTQSFDGTKYHLFRQIVFTLHVFIALGISVAVICAIIQV